MHGGTRPHRESRARAPGKRAVRVELIRDCEEILAASNRPSPLNRYALKHWAADGLAQLREEFESGSRPLLAQLDVTSAPPGRDGPVPVESDVRWLT